MAAKQFTNVYDLDYFSGSQMFLYIGDVWIDEVTHLSYQTVQNKTPLYGYASQLFDATADGHVLVQGQFTINFKEQGYLWAVLRRVKQISLFDTGHAFDDKATKKQRAKLKKYNRQLSSQLVGGAQNPRPVLGSNGNAIQRASIERMIQGDVTRTERQQFYNDLASYATFDVESPKDKVFEDIVEAFEDQVWTQPDESLNTQIRRTDHNAFDDFDMYVVFGNYANPKANHTVQKIIGVRLTSQGKEIRIDGQPIQEHYSFIAQTVA